MRKNNKIMLILVLVFGFFFGTFITNARIIYTSGMQCEKALNSDSIVCNLGFEVTENDSSVNKVKTEFTLTNVLMDSIVLEDDWYLNSKNDTSFTIETSKDTLGIGYHKIATVVFHKINEAEECTVKFRYEFEKIDRTCSLYQGKYYGLKGTIVDYLTYQKECEKHVCTVLPDGTKYGKDGVVVDDLTYQKECEKNICTVLQDGTKYGKDGLVVDDLTYQKECEKNICTVLQDGTKYGKDGVIVDDLTYQKECEKNTCTVLPDGTKYGKDGVIVDDLTYQKEWNEIWKRWSNSR